MPSESEVKDKVREILADESNKKLDSIKDDSVVTDVLADNAVQIARTTTDLREYIKEHQPSKTISRAEVAKPNQKVAELAKVVHERVGE